MKKMKMTIRITIVALITFLIIVTGAIITAVNYVGSKNSIYYLADNMMQEISKYVTNKTLTYLDPAIRNNKQLSYLIENNILDKKNINKSVKYFKKVLKANKEFVMVYYGSENGNLFMAKKMPDNSFTKRIITRTKNSIKISHTHQNKKYNKSFPSKTESLITGYDPRRRIWYKRAKQEKNLIWTDVYTFASDNKPGISNAIPIYNKDKTLDGILSIDVGVIELSYFLNTLEIGKKGKAFIINRNNKIIALPISNKNEINKLFKKQMMNNKEKFVIASINDIKDFEIKDSFQKYSQNGNDLSKVFIYTSKNENYLAKYTRFPKNSGLDWTIGIIIPEKDIMGSVINNNKKILFISFALIIITVLIGFFFSKSISNPLRLLSKEMDKIKDFQIDSSKHIKSRLIEVNRMKTSFESMKNGLLSFRKFVPADLVAQLIKLRKEAILGGEKKDLTIFFSDIADFTSISENLNPESLVERLGKYFKIFSKTIIDSKGTVDKYIGDAVMAFWGAPNPLPNHATEACLTALKCKQLMKKISDEYQEKGDSFFKTRIGINTGEVIVGNMGYENRLNYTVIGDAVNIASRLEGLNKYYGTGIIISKNTYLQAQNFIEARKLDLVAVKGKEEGIAIYELVSEKDNINNATKEFINLFNEGVDLYLSQKWEEAIKIFTQTIQKKKNDKPSHILLKRCENYKKNPPLKNWSGITLIKQK